MICAFQTSRSLDGSDAMNPDPEYSAAYVVLETDGDHEGHGLTFTIGRGNEICVAAIEALGALVSGIDLGWFTEVWASPMWISEGVMHKSWGMLNHIQTACLPRLILALNSSTR